MGEGSGGRTRVVALGRTRVDTLERDSGGKGRTKDTSQVLALGAWWMEEIENPGWA